MNVDRRMNKRDSQVEKVGLRQIATASGVSISTASRVLNGSCRVDSALKKAVLDAAAKLNVDLSSRDKAKALVFLVGNRAMSDSFHSRILIGAETACVAHGWDILFLSYNYSWNTPWKELHLPKVVQRHDMVRGVILTGTNFANLIKLLHNRGITSVVLGNNFLGSSEDFQADSVSSDEIQGAADAVRYLIGLGHRAIWFVGNDRLPWFARCLSGYRRAMEDAGLEPKKEIIYSENNSDIGFLGIKSLLSRGELVTAVLAGTDQTAHGVYKGLRDSGLSIPDDVSVVGCNDMIGAMLHPALTTIHEFPEQLGRQMVELLLNRIARPFLPPQVITIPTEFVKRDSCGPVRVLVP